MLGLTLGHYDSGEDESIYGLKDTLLSRYATRDPGLVGPIGAIIKRLAEQNAKKERLKCARWADHNAIREAHYREVFTQQREKLKAAGKLHLRRV
jgi:N-acyl-D-aspartate/D-glutamate deacylase